VWNPDGTLATTTDANGHPTTYNSYDLSGLPTRITDAKGQVTQISYDDDGKLVWLQDPLHAGDSGSDTRSYRQYFDYDSFHRLGRQSSPKSTRFDRGQLIWSSAAYDANDNMIKMVDARYGASDPGTGPTTTFTYNAMDRRTLLSNPQGEQTKVDYDQAGRATQVTSPKGMLTGGVVDKDFATLYEYDDLDRVIRQKRHMVDATGAITATRITYFCYDLAGDLRSITRPNANLATVACPSTGPATGVGFTSTYDYDKAHRQLATIDALGHRQARHYDANGNVDSTTNANNITTTTTTTYDQRDLPVQVTQPFDPASGRTVTTRFVYDAVGNRTRLISPRAFDAGGPSGPWTQYVTDYAYDQVDQLTRTDLPKTSAETERQSIHRAYDPNGNLEWTSLPVAAQTLPTSPTLRPPGRS
jgi:YD repeat-containing protein